MKETFYYECIDDNPFRTLVTANTKEELDAFVKNHAIKVKSKLIQLNEHSKTYSIEALKRIGHYLRVGTKILVSNDSIFWTELILHLPIEETNKFKCVTEFSKNPVYEFDFIRLTPKNTPIADRMKNIKIGQEVHLNNSGTIGVITNISESGIVTIDNPDHYYSNLFSKTELLNTCQFLVPKSLKTLLNKPITKYIIKLIDLNYTGAIVYYNFKKGKLIKVHNFGDYIDIDFNKNGEIETVLLKNVFTSRKDFIKSLSVIKPFEKVNSNEILFVIKTEKTIAPIVKISDDGDHLISSTNIIYHKSTVTEIYYKDDQDLPPEVQNLFPITKNEFVYWTPTGTKIWEVLEVDDTNYKLHARKGPEIISNVHRSELTQCLAFSE